MMQVKDLRKYLDTGIKFKAQVDAFEFQLNLIEGQLKDILDSDDLENLPEDVQANMIIPRVRALRYWKIQLDDYKDKHLIALVNVLKNVKNTELDVTLEEAKRYFVTPDVETLDVELEDAKRKAKEAAAETVDEVQVEYDPDADPVEESEDSRSDDDILKQLMAEQKS